MKKKLVFALIACLFSILSMACDICGCGAGGGYLGLLPGFRKKFLSLRYLQNGLISHLGPGSSYTYLTSKETFRIAEFWGAMNLGKKFRVAGFIPVNIMERSNGTGHYTQSGPGDATIIGYYQLLNKKQTTKNSQLLVQSLWIGTGLKLPIGKYNSEEKNVLESAQNTFQLGTGSVDLSLHTMYDIRLQDAGININSSYKFNTRNKYGYRYGNKLTANILTYYKFRLGKMMAVVPNTGVLYESASKDHKTREIKIWETGGRSLMATIGTEFSLGRFGLGLNYQTPLSQNLGEGKVVAKDRGMVYISYSF